MLKAIAICAALMLPFVAPALAEDAPQAQAAPQATAADDDVPQSVKDACQADYDKHCSQHGHDKQAVRDCMVAAFEKLSDTCVTAILDSPLAEQPDTEQAATEPKDESKPDQNIQRVSARETVPADTRKANAARDGDTGHATAKRRHSTAGTPSRQAKSAKQRLYVAQAKPVRRADGVKRQPRKQDVHYASHKQGSKKSVASYIKRGTGIANYYVAKYTRFAFAKAFH